MTFDPIVQTHLEYIRSKYLKTQVSRKNSKFPFTHIACVFNKTGIQSIGMNGIKNKSVTSIHAEHDAISRLQANKKGKLISVDILVIRVTKTGKIGMSKPCKMCSHDIIHLPQKYGYRIRKIYFSNTCGGITPAKPDVTECSRA